MILLKLYRKVFDTFNFDLEIHLFEILKMLYYEGLRYGLCYGLCYRQRYRIALGLSYGRRYSLRPYTYMKNGVKIIILSNYAQPTMCSEICTCKIASRSFLVR